MTDISRMRVSDADRSSVIDILQQASVEGRLDLDELDERIASALAARTAGDLEPLLEDLPIVEPPQPQPDDDYDDEPVVSSPATRVGALTTAAVGAGALAASFATPWGALAGLIPAILGAALLLGPKELARSDRAAVLTGMVLGLLPSVFFLMLLVILDR